MSNPSELVAEALTHLTAEDEPETPQDGTEAQESVSEDAAQDDDTESFPAEVVRSLRTENKNLRNRAQTAEGEVDRLSRELFAMRVAATGRLSDSSDLEYSADLTDADAVNAALDELLGRKPHLASRRPNGAVGQGVKGKAEPDVSFVSLLKSAL